MPRTVEELLAKAHELARRFEDDDPEAPASLDGRPLRDVREAFEDFALAQKRLAERVAVAKAAGHSWAAIGAMLGTTGEAARQRYGQAPAPTAAPGRKAGTVSKRGTLKAAPAKGGAIKAMVPASKSAKTAKAGSTAETVKVTKTASGSYVAKATPGKAKTRRE
jgi:hypothetical protein